MDSICVKAADMLTQSREHGTQQPAGASPSRVSDHFEVPTGFRLAARSELGRETTGSVFPCPTPYQSNDHTSKQCKCNAYLIIFLCK